MEYTKMTMSNLYDLMRNESTPVDEIDKIDDVIYDRQEIFWTTIHDLADQFYRTTIETLRPTNIEQMTYCNTIAVQMATILVCDYPRNDEPASN